MNHSKPNRPSLATDDLGTQKQLLWHYWGKLPYQEAWLQQKEFRKRRIAGEIPDTLMLLEHPPTITLGRLRGEKSLQASEKDLLEQGVTVIRSDRGGDATLHAPGQLVGYLIVNLHERRISLPRFVETLAGVFITYLRKEHRVDAHYDTTFPGVWIGSDKIVAFGFHLQEDVTMHGFAFNLSTHLPLFDLIVPCGLQQKGVASLQQYTETPPTPEAIAPLLAHSIASSLGLVAQS